MRTVTSILLILGIFISFPLTIQAMDSSEKKMVKKQIEFLKKSKLAGGYKATEVTSVHLLGRDIPETFTIYVRGEGLKDVVYRAQTYETESKQWRTVYKDWRYDQFGASYLLEQGKLIDTKKEQVVVGPFFGSGAIITPELIGSTDGKQVRTLLQPDKSYSFGNVKIKNKTLYLGTASIVHDTYRYEKNKWKHRIGTGQDDRDLAGPVTKWLKLSQKKGKARFSTSRNVKLRVGDTFAIVRADRTDTSPFSYRTLQSGSSKMKYLYPSVFKAIKKGKEEWTFDEHAYGLYTTLTFSID